MNLKIINIDVSELKQYENNARHNEKAIGPVVNSIREFGFRNPIIIDKNNVIVAGHTRLEAAKLLELDKVPCIMIDDLSEEQINAFRLVDNKTNELSTWDFDKLEEELKELTNINMISFGFEDISEINLDDFFEEQEQTPKEKKQEEIQCPHCKMWFFKE